MNQSAWMNLLIVGVMIGAGAAGNAASAADNDEQQPALETIIVTAQKRAENLQEVPISMEVLTAQSLEDHDLTSVRSLQNYVPNLLVEQGGDVEQYFIRGFGSASANDAFDQSVSMYVDGVYAGRNRQFQQPFFDVSQVDVLRGPQGALLGKNTAAGAIIITTANPTDTFQASGTVSYDFNRNGESVFGFVSGPLVDTLTGRIAFNEVSTDGWVRNVATGTDDPVTQIREIRPSLEFKPSDGVDIIGKFDYSSVYKTGNDQVQTSTTYYSVATTKDEANPFGIPLNDRTTSQNASLTGHFALGPNTLESITGYSAYDNTYHLGAVAGTPEVFVVGYVDSLNQISQEIRLVSPTHQTIDYIVGAYYDENTFITNNTSTYDFGGGFAGQVETFFKQHAITSSVFGQATWNILDSLRLVGSLRETYEHKSATFFEDTNYGVPLATAPLLIRSESENHTDPTVTLQYDIAPDVMVYATYAQGSKAGGFVSNTQAVVAADFQFKPEKSKNYEVGIKSTFFDRRLLLNVSVYDTKFTNLQVSTFDPKLVTYITGNAASATSKGVEWSAAWVLSQHLKLSGSGAYLDAKYNDFPGAQCLTTTPAAQCINQTTNLAGTTVPTASTWTGNLGLEFNHALADGWNFSSLAATTYRSAYFVSGDQNPYYGYQPGFSKYDGNIAINKGQWTIALVGTNLSNKVTKSFAYNFNGIGVANIDETRSVKLQARFRY
jgi:iron complex outermembrane receptor protein